MRKLWNGGNDEKTNIFKWQAKRMSNYLQYLLTKDLDLSDPDKPEKQYQPRFFHPILDPGNDKSKKQGY